MGLYLQSGRGAGVRWHGLFFISIKVAVLMATEQQQRAQEKASMVEGSYRGNGRHNREGNSRLHRSSVVAGTC
jgi:hypothetical protein